ncbi:MAG TPA: adenine deaminase C-terminal domain-containing protein, partial [Chitinophagaceae bacterium]|nr:adenine deaminase C-terminal domain-containing protein [Chitinophagaceae bacterium]
FEVIKTFINGQLVAEDGKSKIETAKSSVINNFSCSKKKIEEFEVKRGNDREVLISNLFIADSAGNLRIPVIEALDGQLITNKILYEPAIINGKLESDLEDDILKIVVVNRYKDALIAKAFINNFKLLKGAIASSVAHDSHNIVAVGVDDASICKAVNLVIEKQGGVSAVDDEKEMVLALPVAGLMSNEDGYEVAESYTAIDKMVKEELGSTLSAPFMTLSFMALLVIPHLKLSDKGLFDGDKFEII